MPALSDSPQSKDKLDELLAGCFTLQKMYGRAPDSMETVTLLFHNIMGPYPAEKVVKAFEIWLKKSQEFPTPADIISIIKHNGREPVAKEIYISISRKDYDERTPSERRLMARYEDEQETQQWDLQADDEKKQVTLNENIRLRKQIKDLQAKVDRAWTEVKRLRPYENMTVKIASLSEMDKVERTIAAMQSEGAKQEDIEAFRGMYA